jgi:hypothetical protein
VIDRCGKTEKWKDRIYRSIDGHGHGYGRRIRSLSVSSLALSI